MKIIYKFLVLLFALTFIVSCMEESVIEGNPDFTLSFNRDGRSTALAGTTFYVLPKGTGDFLTLYDGTAGHVYGDSGAVGTDFNKLDSLGITYDSIGTHLVTVVATSIGRFGQDITKKVKTVEVKVVDERNSFAQFIMNNASGTITDNQVTFSFPDVTTNFKYIPVFRLASNSTACTVKVNGVLQQSGVSEQTFTPMVPVIYTIKSPEGVERNYSVVVSTYKSSTESVITKFSLASGLSTNGNGEIAQIDNVAKTITLNANYATDITSVKVVAESSYASSLKVGTGTYSSTRKYNLTTATSWKVIAEDKVTTSIYTLKVNVQDPITDFTFDGFSPAPVRTIDKSAKTITIDVAKGTDVSRLKAIWSGSVGVVSVNTGVSDSIQTNGITANDFSTPRKYTFYKGNASANDITQLTVGDVYTVIVNQK